MDLHNAAQDELELGDLENDAFIPSRGLRKQNSRSNNVIQRWFPRIWRFLESLSRIKIVILTLCVFFLFLLLLALSSRISRSTTLVVVPAESLNMSIRLATNLSATSVPGYVLKYAPFVLLDKRELFYPSDLATHVSNTHAALNFSTMGNAPDPLTLDNLDELNNIGAEDVFLTSTSPLIGMPQYLHGQAPNSKTLQTENAISCIVIVVEKGNEIVDAFYMYFYTFNQGPTVLGHEVGHHLGDWEHNMIRFEGGRPKAIWYSQHEYGEAFDYKAVQKVGKRPISYCALGTHANYAVAGSHDLHKNNEKIPARLAYDQTSQGRLWDPALSAYYYTYSIASAKLDPATKEIPVNFLYFNGAWGDKEYPDKAEGQEDFHGVHKWASGPQGPLWKHLDRADICLPRDGGCMVQKVV